MAKSFSYLEIFKIITDKFLFKCWWKPKSFVTAFMWRNSNYKTNVIRYLRKIKLSLLLFTLCIRILWPCFHNKKGRTNMKYHYVELYVIKEIASKGYLLSIKQIILFLTILIISRSTFLKRKLFYAHEKIFFRDKFNWYEKVLIVETT